MEEFPIKKLGREYWPEKLGQIPDPPSTLYYRGALPDVGQKFLCIIGPRKYTEYGEKVCQEIIHGLRGLPITIVSGLAYGIDSIAHRLALENGLNTITFPGSGLNESVLYPKVHFNLAKQILENNGTLISEFDNNLEAAPWTFPKRNRLMAGISDAVLVIEAGEKSGTMITSRLALDYNRDVLCVPGSILNRNSIGTNNLIKEGATPILSARDVIEALGFNFVQTELFQKENLHKKLNDIEDKILKILDEPQNIDQLSKKVSYILPTIIQTLTELELKNLIGEIDGKFYRK